MVGHREAFAHPHNHPPGWLPARPPNGLSDRFSVMRGEEGGVGTLSWRRGK